LVTGDLNAHNPLWGSELKNYNGDTIESCLEILDLVILNDGSPTRLTPPGTRPSAVDLTLASPQIAIKLSWHVIPDCGSSDHFPILTTSGDRERHGDIVQMTAKRNYKRADWNSFYTFLETVVDQQFCEGINRNTSLKEVWSMVKRFAYSVYGGKNINFPNTEVAREILDNLTPVVVQPEFQITANKYEIEKFNMVEFENSIAGKKDKATGLDEVSYSMISNLPIRFKQMLLNQFNKYLEGECIPADWKNFLIYPFLKPERDPNIPSSYRPIALASCVGKLWENLIKTRVEWTVEQNNLIPEKQYGFRRGKSVTDNLCYITSFVQLGFSRNMYTLGVFLVIKGAYDDVDIYVLYKKLESTGIPTYLINSIFQTVCNRAIYVRDKTGGLVGPKLANLGLAQGSPLSPLLFNIYIGDMQKDMLPNIETLFYADDVVLLISGYEINGLVNLMNTALETLRKWFGDNNLTLSTSKSKAILIRKALNVMRALCGTKWGADPASLLNIYKGLIRSHLDYGCQAISPLTKTNEKILNSLQFKALRIITGCLRSTPTNALLSECAEMDIKHRIIWLTIKYLARVHSISEHPLQSILEDLNEYCLTKEDYWKNREYPAIISAMHFLAPYVQHIKKFRNIPCYIIEHKYFTYELEYIELKLKKGNDNATEFLHLTSELYEGYCKIYTDGSLDPIQEKVGIGMYVPQYEYSFHDSVPKMAQICTAETIAIHKACTFCLENDIKKAVIFSDSQSALKKLTSNKLNKDLDYITLLTKEMLINCNFNGTIIKLAWVPGHTGIDGNERADKNANLGKQLPITNNILLDKADVLAYCKKKYHNNWIKEWDNSFNHKGKWYKAIQPQFPKTPWFNKGHCLTDQHKFKIGIADSPLCECGQLGDPDHLFFGCEINKIPTFDLYQTLIQTHNTPGPLNIKCVLYNLTANTA
ncbi:hypothetical protein NQ315_013980, partial [Exocentrus adspersus]